MSDFQRRHYETIATSIAAAYKHASDLPNADAEKVYPLLDRLATTLADDFERDNPNFNRVRFFLAADAIEWVDAI